MIKINGRPGPRQRIWHPEWDADKINTRGFRTNCNLFLMSRGIVPTDMLGRTEEERHQRKKARAVA